MAKLNATEFAEKWGRNLKNARSDIERGIDRVTESPGAKAAAKADKWHARVSEQDAKSKFKANVAAVSLGEWKEKAKSKGLNRIAAGVDGASNKMKEFAGALIPFVESGQSKIESMPDVTKDDSRARMNAWFEHMSGFKYKK